MDWKYIILHHTATTSATTVDQIRKDHMARGWVDIGYNYLVDFNGTVYDGRPLNICGAHCYGYNDKAIGVAAIGNFEFNTCAMYYKK